MHLSWRPGLRRKPEEPAQDPRPLALPTPSKEETHTTRRVSESIFIKGSRVDRSILESLVPTIGGGVGGPGRSVNSHRAHRRCGDHSPPLLWGIQLSAPEQQGCLLARFRPARGLGECPLVEQEPSRREGPPTTPLSEARPLLMGEPWL